MPENPAPCLGVPLVDRLERRLNLHQVQGTTVSLLLVAKNFHGELRLLALGSGGLVLPPIPDSQWKVVWRRLFLLLARCGSKCEQNQDQHCHNANPAHNLPPMAQTS